MADLIENSCATDKFPSFHLSLIFFHSSPIQSFIFFSSLSHSFMHSPFSPYLFIHLFSFIHLSIHSPIKTFFLIYLVFDFLILIFHVSSCINFLIPQRFIYHARIQFYPFTNPTPHSSIYAPTYPPIH